MPDEYLCPITTEIMTDPVTTLDGFTYERAAIAEWLRTKVRVRVRVRDIGSGLGLGLAG